jgi:prefoldin subunit 5
MTTSVSSSVPSGASNSRGIPPAHFIEDVSAYVTEKRSDPEAILKELQTLYGKYKFMESQLVQQQKSLLTKIPDISSALSSVQFLMTKKKHSIHFELADSLYAQASVNHQDKVALWLGANVMLEYSYSEAEQLLQKNKSNAEITLSSLEEDLAFLKDQITISEVNIARLHNYKVALKQEKESGEKKN